MPHWQFSPALHLRHGPLLAAAHSALPGLVEARVIHTESNLRPALPDNLPRIDCPEAGVMRINGLYRHGYLISPAVVDAALAWLLQGSDDLAQQWQLCAS